MKRDYDVKHLLKYEISNHPQYLTKEKTSDCKSQLAKSIEDHLEKLTIKEVFVNKSRSCTLFDFTA